MEKKQGRSVAGFRNAFEVILKAGTTLKICEDDTLLYMEYVGEEERHYCIDSWPLNEAAMDVSLKAMKYDIIEKIIGLDDHEVLRKTLLEYLNNLVFEDDYFYEVRPSAPTPNEVKP